MTCSPERDSMENLHASGYNIEKITLECEKINIPPDIVTKAKGGDATAQLKLGKTYFNATSIENNGIFAFQWISCSAEKGNMEAQFRLGDMYALGSGTAKSLSDSYKWYTKAAIQGYKKALIRINNLYQEDLKMHCRGQIHSKEEGWTCDDFKKKNKIRELYEYRLEQNKPILNGAITYYTHQFKQYQSSDQKDAAVQLNLAFLYQHGYGTKKYTRWAFEYYSLAAEQGDRDAQYNLGCLYQQHTDKKFNVRDAFKWYTQSAQSGHMAAQRCLAYFYLKGLVTEINYETAVFWYTKSAEAGDAQAQVTLGKFYRKGEYVKQDLSVAVRWYGLAARQGNTVAQNCLSKLHQRDLLKTMELEEDMLVYLTEEAMNSRLCSKLSTDVSKLDDVLKSTHFNKLVKRALIGDGPAMYEIGLMYYGGNKGLSQDKDMGVKWIKNAANREYRDAQFKMAELYKRGESIEQDYHKLSNLYRSIAKKKNIDAQCQVGILYKKGLGVRKDPLEASKWFTWAADQENSDGQLHFGLLRLYGNGIREDKKEAEEWLKKSVFQRNTQACYKLGKLYVDGQFDTEKKTYQKPGLILLEFAAKHDHVDAQLFLGDMYKKGEGPQKDIRKSIEYYTLAIDSGNKEALFKLATVYLFGDGINHDYIKAYNLFKSASNKGYTNANWLFQTPVVYDPNINNYNNVIDMFIEVTEKKLDDLAYNIGFVFEMGVMDHSRNQHFDINYTDAQMWYLNASEKNKSKADYRLGIMYEFGKGVQKNITTAIDYYNNVIKKGNHDAMYRRACMYLTEYGVDKNYLEAFHLYTKASTMGNERATDILTGYEFNGNITYYVVPILDKDIHVNGGALIRMLEKATEEGYSRLQYELGVMYERTGDFSNAFKWLNLAAEIGITDAYFRLGVLYEEGKGVEQSYNIAADMYQKATGRDHKDACFRLGHLYQYGKGVELDYLKSYSFYKKAADMNHKMAARVLNITLDTMKRANGDIVDTFFDSQSKDYQDSFTLCKHVAQYGNTEVQFHVGFAYEKSHLEPDYVEAFNWYSMAAKGSHKEAVYRLGLLYEKGLGVSQNYHKAVDLYKHAYQLGSYDALFRLGTMYHHGKGIEINPSKAVECYTLSAKLGNPEYQCELGRLYEEGELVQKNLLDALKWYTKAYLQGYDNIASKLYSIYIDKPYECYFDRRLFRNLSVASSNYFKLNEKTEYRYLGTINNRLGFMYLFGIGTVKNLKQSLEHFMKDYSDKPKRPITELHCFEHHDFSFSQKIDILKAFADSDECMDQFTAEEWYRLGMVYFDGKIQAQNLNINAEENIYMVFDERSLIDPIEKDVIEKDYSKAFNYITRAADKKHPEGLLQLGIMYYCGYGVEKSSNQGDRCFEPLLDDDIDFMLRIAILFHTHNDMQDFSKALKYYNQLEKRLAKKNSGISENDGKKFNALIQTGLGLLYEYGDGVEQDYEKALDYYKQIADDKHNMGHLRLGLMYYHGKGVPVDYKEALGLFVLGLGNRMWGDNIPYVYDKNYLQANGNDNYQKKLVYCTKTGKEIRGEINYYVGLIYKYGQGISKNVEYAHDHFIWARRRACQRAANE